MKNLIDSYYSYNPIVQYNYEVKNSCQERGCNDEGICRCGVIVDAKVKNVDVTLLANTIYSSYYGDDKVYKRNYQINIVLFGTGEDLDIYTIDRILRIHKICDPYNWKISIFDGYYGQEIDGVYLDETLRKKLESCIYTALDIDNINQRVEYLLKLEYDYILPELEGCNYSVTEVSRNDVYLGNVNHCKKVKSENLDHYKNYNGIMGVVLADGSKYRLIDGYHRMLSTNLSYVKVIKAEK